MNVLTMPEHYGLLSPVLHLVAQQLLAYHVALVKGTDVDKPRNLAKSVTVEWGGVSLQMIGLADRVMCYPELVSFAC